MPRCRIAINHEGIIAISHEGIVAISHEGIVAISHEGIIALTQRTIAIRKPSSGRPHIYMAISKSTI